MFVSEFARLTFTSVEQNVSFVVLKGSEEVFRTSFFTDSRGRVTVYDLDRLLETLIPDLYAEFTFLINDVPLGMENVKIFRCATSVNEPGQTFIPDFFLTSSMAERNTCHGRYECLSAYCETETPVVAECAYYLADGSLTTVNVDVAIVNGAASIDVSPDLFENPDLGQLVAYVINCGRRQARFRVLAYMPEYSPAVIFRNSFNCWETMYLTGTKETSSSYERSVAYICGRLRNYHIDETMTFKANTGPLRPGELPIALDLARSKEVFMLNANGSTGTEITITDANIKHSNEDSEIKDLTITYRLADIRNIAFDTARPPMLFNKIFDKTFDNTYE